MPLPVRDDTPVLPPALKIAGSAVVLFHFIALGGMVISAPSGPWFPGSPQIPGPQFAAPIEVAASPYLLATRMTHTYRFAADRPRPTVYFEVNLTDENGRNLKTRKFPDPKASPWVRHRQRLLAEGLFGDTPVPPPQGERLGAPPRTIWEPVPPQPGEKPNPDKMVAVLKSVPEHLVPRDRPVLSPSEWSLLLAKAYARHLCREHNAVSAEIVRHSREQVLPPTWLPRMPGQERAEPPDPLFMELVYNFGVHRRED